MPQDSALRHNHLQLRIFESRTLQPRAIKRRALKQRLIERRALKLRAIEGRTLKLRVIQMCVLQMRADEIALCENGSVHHRLFQMAATQIDQIILPVEFFRIIDLKRFIEVESRQNQSISKPSLASSRG